MRFVSYLQQDLATFGNIKVKDFCRFMVFRIF